MPGGQMMPGPQMMPGGQMNHGHMMAGMNGVKGGKQKKTVGTNVPGRPDMIVGALINRVVYILSLYE